MRPHSFLIQDGASVVVGLPSLLSFVVFLYMFVLSKSMCALLFLGFWMNGILCIVICTNFCYGLFVVFVCLFYFLTSL